MLIYRNKNIKIRSIIITYILSLMLIFIGAIMKINENNSISNLIITLGLILKIQIILIVLNKYSYKLRELIK